MTQATDTELLKRLDAIGADIQDIKISQARTEEKFNSIDQQFNGIDQRFNGIQQQVTELDKSLS
jgi:archaellum component FlaC